MATDAIANAQSSSGIWRTAIVAARSAVSAIALIAIFDRQFVASQWLAWVIQNWNSLLWGIFDSLDIGIHPAYQPAIAFTLIVLSTIGTDLALRYRTVVQPHRATAPSTLWQMGFSALLGAALLVFLLASPVGYTLQKALYGTPEPPTLTAEQMRAEAEALLNDLEPIEPYDPNATGIVGFLQWARGTDPAELTIVYALAAATLLFAVLASFRMFLWLAVFTATFVGVDQLALFLSRALPTP